ncbi:LOW QUALITY PROTEIN: hypothetical protein ACHAW5_007688 [Stephanodiscus triporus]|uniref:Uncharacterized protein n=1 Tax=Stephanodiscus triporus TaxID=2934178 RepID=A0ABD3Q6M0_9STRA
MDRQRSGRIQGGLARIIRVTTLPPDDDEREGSGPIMYGIEYVLGGKLFNLQRCELTYKRPRWKVLLMRLIALDTCSVGDGSRRQMSQAKELDKGGANESKATTKRAANDVDTPLRNRKPGRPPGSKNKSGILEESLTEGVVNEKSSKNAKKRQRSSKTSEDECNAGIFEIRSQASKAGWETRRPFCLCQSYSKPASKPAAKKGQWRRQQTLTVDTNESDATSTNTLTMEDSADSRCVALYTKHRKEMEKSLIRLEKLDRFGFFLEATPPQFDENYDCDDGDVPGNDDLSVQAAHKRYRTVPFPDKPPFDFLIVRKRLAAGL